jgi:hypothetical protein
MRSWARLLIVALVAGIGLGWAPEASAALSGGSRLIYPFTQTALSGPGDGQTLFSIVNNASDPVNVAIVFRNGANCTGAAFSRSLGGNETQQFDVADFVLPASFPWGIIEVYAVAGGGAPLRWDWLTGEAIVIDASGGFFTATTVNAAMLFSDDKTNPGTNIADNSNLATFGPVSIGAPTFPQVPGLLTETVVLFGPALDPGTVPAPATGSSAMAYTFYTQAGASTAGSAETTCVFRQTLEESFGPALGAGRVQAFLGPNKGIVGWKFLRYTDTSVNVGMLLGQPMPSTVVIDASAHP